MLSALAADRGRIADIEAQISLLERSISEWQSKKQLFQERLDSYRYPVLTLPNEIVGEIFVHVLPIYRVPHLSTAERS
jgi:disulfide oxidoreductase YuzD